VQALATPGTQWPEAAKRRCGVVFLQAVLILRWSRPSVCLSAATLHQHAPTTRRFAAVLEATGGVGPLSAFVVGECGVFHDDTPPPRHARAPSARHRAVHARRRGRGRVPAVWRPPAGRKRAPHRCELGAELLCRRGSRVQTAC
jgi:hypothetical protein